ESFTKEIVSNPEIVYVKIASQGITLSEAGPDEFLKTPRNVDYQLAGVNDGVFDVSTEIIESGIAYGEITMGMSIDNIQRVLSETKNWSISIAGLEVILVALFSFLLGTYLTAQLSRLKSGTQLISSKGPGHQIEVNGSDEIAELTKSFNDMSFKLKNSYENLENSLVVQNQLLKESTENEAKTNAMLSASLDGLITIDTNGLVLDYNSTAEIIFGWTREDIINKTLADFIIPEHLREAHQQGMKHYIDTGVGAVFGKRLELPALHKSGNELLIEIAISPIEIETGSIFIAFIRDISERNRIETELRLSAKAFETIEPIFITDDQVNCIRTNRAFEKVTGYKEAEVIGKNPRDFLKSGLHDKAFYDEMWQQIRSNGEWKGEILNIRKNGEVYPEYLSISSVYDTDGNRTHYVAHFTDISEQKKTEENLKNARQEAEMANEAKSRFLATMSHEIRTPLGAVLGILDMLKITGLNQNQSNLVKTGEQSGKQLLEIINTILDFSRMKAGKMKLEPHPLRLHEIFSNTKEMLNTHAENKGLQLKLNIDPDVPKFALGDATRIRQILINLINNAVKFTDKGQVDVKCFYEPIDDKSFRLITQVIDTGIGISQDFQKILFDEFTMSDQSHSRKQEGSGLGLTISKQLSELMKGSIRFSSNKDHGGSIFEFNIKLEFESEENVISYEHQFKPKTIIHNEHIKVLIAEDNEANRMVFGSYLSSAGIQHEFAKNGIEAIEVFKKADFDIVLMDISMPLMDGISATHELRKLEKQDSPTPIIALTAHTMEEEIDRYLTEGMNDHLSKPCNKEDMLRCIVKWTTLETSIAATSPEPILENTSSSTHNGTELVDDKVITQLIHDTSEEIVPELLEFYIIEANKLISNILEAKSNHDAQALEFHSHTLGSSSGAHAAMQLHELARKIEHYCRDGYADKAFELIDELQVLAEQSFKALAEIAQGLAASQ
ncbi:MAG: PAS domain S-box protein, partial [Gammaproteobacteria bacterium]|nr:PAS domain S-box protein [Gammaproteobacteria bacterium]